MLILQPRAYLGTLITEYADDNPKEWWFDDKSLCEQPVMGLGMSSEAEQFDLI